MKIICITLLLIIAAMTNAQEKPSIQSTIIGLEKAALERWCQGDPTAFLELSAPDVVYFDPFLDRRLNGIDELTKLYMPLKGQVNAEQFEMIDPVVQATDKMAVLTFNFRSQEGEKLHKWNCTEVYRLEADGKWKIVQTHWSLTKPELK
jgi:ketosteroid isomerase-like protein